MPLFWNFWRSRQRSKLHILPYEGSSLPLKILDLGTLSWDRTTGPIAYRAIALKPSELIGRAFITRLTAFRDVTAVNLPAGREYSYLTFGGERLNI